MLEMNLWFASQGICYVINALVVWPMLFSLIFADV